MPIRTVDASSDPRNADEPAKPSLEVQHAFAAAVAAVPRARALLPDNRTGPVSPLAELVGQPLVVTPRTDLLVLDLDLPADDAVTTRRRRQARDRIVLAAREEDIPHVVQASGSAGHEHLLLVLGAGVHRQVLAAWCQAEGLDVRDQGVRPPLTPHRLGRSVRLLWPDDPARALAMLSTPPPAEAARRLLRRMRLRPLSTDLERLLLQGHEGTRFDSESNGRLALACSLRGAGHPYAVLLHLLKAYSGRGLRSFGRKPEAWQHVEAARVWELAGRHVGQADVDALGNSTEADRQAVADWLAAVDAASWKAVAGGTDRAVLGHFGRLARTHGRVIVGSAQGDVALGAGVSADTAGRSLRRLVLSGWLAVYRAHTVREATIYELRVPPGFEAAWSVESGDDVPACSVDLSEDVFRARALGKTAGLAYEEVLRTGPLSVAQLADRLRITRNAARLRLKKLELHGLVRRLSDGPRDAREHWVAADCALAQVAVRNGTAGRKERQQRELLVSRAARTDVLQERQRLRQGRTGARTGGAT